MAPKAISIFLVAILTSPFIPPCSSFVLQILDSGQRTKRLQNTNSKRILRTDFLQSAPQLLEFKEPTTGVNVKLIGCMHYNPASIQLTLDTIQDLADRQELGSVVIESCDIRWNQTQQLPAIVQNALNSEMKTACDVSLRNGRPVILGDQRINLTVDSVRNGLKETLVDLGTPWGGGWNRLLQNITVAREVALPLGNQFLNPKAFFDPKLILAAPVSLIKYPLSYFFKAPIRTSIFFSLVLLAESDAAMIDSTQQYTMTIYDWITSFTLSGLEIVVFARIFLKELLAERNEFLAQNILAQCQLYQTNKAKRESSALWRNPWNPAPQQRDLKVIYVDSPDIAKAETPTASNKGMSVVAVLGMAHCNGIKKLLQEQLV